MIARIAFPRLPREKVMLEVSTYDLSKGGSRSPRVTDAEPISAFFVLQTVSYESATLSKKTL